jgi:hypothetical protein
MFSRETSQELSRPIEVGQVPGVDGLETDKWPPPGLPLVTPLGYFVHDGGHGTLPDDWQVFINFLNIQLRAKMN